MALSLKITRAIPLYPIGNFIQWDVENPIERGDYLFDVYRSGSPNGPWDTLATGVFDTYNYLDTFPSTSTAEARDINPLSLTRGIFYKIVCTPPSGVINQVSTVSSIDPHLDGRQRLIKRKVRRDITQALKRLSGVQVVVLKRRHWGVRCPKCYDPYTQSTVRGSCTTCYGTTFTAGYYTPITSLARRSVAPDLTQVRPEGNSDSAATTITMLDVPKVEKDDILVFPEDNRRFLVEMVRASELRLVSVYQMVSVTELARSDIAYRIVADPTRSPPLF